MLTPVPSKVLTAWAVKEPSDSRARVSEAELCLCAVLVPSVALAVPFAATLLVLFATVEATEMAVATLDATFGACVARAGPAGAVLVTTACGVSISGDAGAGIVVGDAGSAGWAGACAVFVASVANGASATCWELLLPACVLPAGETLTVLSDGVVGASGVAVVANTASTGVTVEGCGIIDGDGAGVVRTDAFAVGMLFTDVSLDIGVLHASLSESTDTERAM